VPFLDFTMTQAREQFIKEYLEWAAKFEDARHRINRILPTRIDVNSKGRPRPLVMTEEMLIEYSRISEEMDEAWSKMRAICDKLTK